MASRKSYQDVTTSMPNNFSAKKPADAKAPKIGSRSFSPSPNSNKRGKDGTQS